MEVQVLAELEALAEALTAVGVPASVEPSEVQVPGAWVTARTAVIETLAGGGTLHAYVYLIAPDNGIRQSHEELGRLLARMPDTWVAGELSLNEGVALPANPNTPLPAYRVPVDLDL